MRRPHSRFDDVTNVAVSERKDVTESLSHTWDRRCFPSGIVWTRMPRKLEPHHKQLRCKENNRLMGNGAIENTERDDADFLSKRTNRVDGLARVRYWKIVLFWNEFSAAGSSWRTKLPFEGRSHGGALGPVWHASDTSICDSIRILVFGYFEKRVWVIFEY